MSPHVAIVFDPNPDLGHDPLDHTQADRRQGEYLRADSDMLLIWREWGEQFEGGFRIHVVGDGSWAHLGIDDIHAALSGLLE